VNHVAVVRAAHDVRDPEVNLAPAAAGQMHDPSVVRAGQTARGIGQGKIGRDDPVEAVPFGAHRGPGVGIEVNVVSDADESARGTGVTGRGGDERKSNSCQQTGSGSSTPVLHQWTPFERLGC
jgi:hypothetical protein